MDFPGAPFRLNAPNVVTLLRFALVPLFLTLALMRLDGAALIVFALAASTDFIDGYLARRADQVTTFGKFADPLADKLLLTAAWLTFVAQGQLGPGEAMVLIGREFLVTGLRTLAATHGTVIAADWWGKWKTAIHIVMALWVLSGNLWGWAPWALQLKVGLIWLSVAASLGSGAAYFARARHLFKR